MSNTSKYVTLETFILDILLNRENKCVKDISINTRIIENIKFN